jgi:predicted nucleic acid-binding protein
LSVPKIVVHTDVLLEHLQGKRSPSVLRLAMSRLFCYTTVFNAIELFGIAKTSAERRSIEAAMGAMKVLGLNPRHAPRYGELLAKGSHAGRWNLLVAGLCIASGLPLLTGKAAGFKGIEGLLIVPPGAVTGHLTGGEFPDFAGAGRRGES